MTKDDYLRAKEGIESKYREDMATIERAWIIIHGSKPPDGIVEPEAEPGLHSAEDLGVRRGATDKMGVDSVKPRKYKHSAAFMAKHRATAK